MPPQTSPGKCSSALISGMISSIGFAIQTPDISIANWSAGDCEACPQCCAVSNAFTDSGPTELSKTYTRNQSGPYFALSQACCSKCGFSLALNDFTAGEKDGNGNPLNLPGLTFAGESYTDYDFPDGNLQNPDGSYICAGQQPASGTADGGPYSFTGSLAFNFHADENGNCVFDLTVSFDDGIGGGTVAGIPLADLSGTHTITYSATITNPAEPCGTTSASYLYEETYTITIA